MAHNEPRAASEPSGAKRNEHPSSADMELVPDDNKSTGDVKHGVSGATEPSGSIQQENRSLCVINALTGQVELHITENDVTWPHEDHELFAYNVLNFLRIDVYDYCLYDLVLNEEPVEEVYFGNLYSLVKRSCARCTICGACCTRTTIHSLCCHGSFDHLWRRMPHGNNADEIQNEASDETRFRHFHDAVTGYPEGDGLMADKGFNDDEIRLELSNIAGEYNITIPDKWITPA